MIIMASHDLESPLQVFDATVLEDVMSIFITSAVLKLVNGMTTESLTIILSTIFIFYLFIIYLPIVT